MSIAEQFEQKINQGDLPKPVPKFLVIAGRVALWIFLALVVSLGSLSAGVAAWFMTDPVALSGAAAGASWVDLFLQALPMFWVAIALVCGILAIIIFIKSARGYKYKRAYVVTACLVGFLALGAALASAGVSDKIDRMAYENIPQYNGLSKPRMLHLMKPDSGFIIGRIQAMDGSKLVIRDPGGGIWEVRLNQETNIPLHFKIQIGDCVRILGDASSTIHTTDARDVRPCPRGIRHMPPQPPPMIER